MSSSSSSSDFRSLGDLLDPNCPIARQAEAEARQEAEQIERIRKAGSKPSPLAGNDQG